MRLRTLLGRAGLDVVFSTFADAEVEKDAFSGGLCLVINADSEKDCSILSQLRSCGNKSPAIIVSFDKLALPQVFLDRASILANLHGAFPDSEFLYWMEIAIIARLALIKPGNKRNFHQEYPPRSTAA